MNHSHFLNDLSSVLPASQVWTHATHPGAMSAYEQDWRKRESGKALAVAFPTSTVEVQAVVRCCIQHGIALVPQGGNTGLVLGSTPDTSGLQLVLNTQRMNRVQAVDIENMSMTVQAGCTLAQVQQKAQDLGLWFPLSMASEGSCTIGGNLAVNAGGTQVLQFGTARHLCLGLEAVLPDGSILNVLRSLRKDNTGYALRDLLIGSEGTLGVITQAVLKLWPQPVSQTTVWLGVERFEDSCALLGLARAHLGARLTGFEVMNPLAIALVKKHMPAMKLPLPEHQAWHVLLEITDSSPAQGLSEDIERFMQLVIQQHEGVAGVQAQTMQQAQQLWHIREAIPLAQAQEGLNIKHDISLPVSQMAAFVSHAQQQLEQLIPGVRLINFGHMGDGNLHFNVQAPEGMDSAVFLQRHEQKVNEQVLACVEAHQGSISAEHGIGRLKQQRLLQHQDPVAVHLMQTIKQAIDPLGLFNPGAVLAAAQHPSTFKPIDPDTII